MESKITWQFSSSFVHITLRLSSEDTLWDRFLNMSMTLETGPRDVGAVVDDDDSVMERERGLMSPGFNS
jgi:hypothetical protein